MSNELLQSMEAVSRSKGIDLDKVITAVEDAYVAAAKKHLHSEENIVCRFDKEKQLMALFSQKHVVESVDDAYTEISLEDAREIDPLSPVDVHWEVADGETAGRPGDGVSERSSPLSSAPPSNTTSTASGAQS